MSSELTYMDCWHYVAPLLPVNTDFGQDVYVMIFNALKEAEKRRIAEKKVETLHIVRCRDCIHRQGDEYPMCMLHTEPYQNVRGYKGEAVCVEMNGFCSYGERREE